jgi:hypothetical protein
MSDITMCICKECSRKETCYRFIAKPSTHLQSTFSPLNKDGSCMNYWKATANQIKRWKERNG